MSECLSTGGGEVVRAGGWVGGIIVTSVSGQSKLVLSLPKAVPRHSGSGWSALLPRAAASSFRAAVCLPVQVGDGAARTQWFCFSSLCIFTSNCVSHQMCVPAATALTVTRMACKQQPTSVFLCNVMQRTGGFQRCAISASWLWKILRDERAAFCMKFCPSDFFFLCLFVYFKWGNITALLFVHRTLILSI